MLYRLVRPMKRKGSRNGYFQRRISAYRGFGDADIAGNLFAQATARDLNHDLALPRA